MIKSKVVYTTLDRLYCDGCGEEMTSSPVALMSNPIQYKYECKCGYVEMTNIRYPAYVCRDEEGHQC